MKDTTVMLSDRTRTMFHARSGKKVQRARHTALISRRLIWSLLSVLVQTPKVGWPSHRAPQLILEAGDAELMRPSIFWILLSGRAIPAVKVPHMGRVNNCPQEHEGLEGSVRHQLHLRLGQNEPVIEVIQYTQSPLSQRRENHIYALCKSAGGQGQSEWNDRVLIYHSLRSESQVAPVKEGYLVMKVSIVQI